LRDNRVNDRNLRLNLPPILADDAIKVVPVGHQDDSLVTYRREPVIIVVAEAFTGMGRGGYTPKISANPDLDGPIGYTSPSPHLAHIGEVKPCGPA